ncbi:MAG TPA: VOC family protein [Anaerolineales bacterium]|nr:VOC family protein [Anaerolineales bacterium]
MATINPYLNFNGNCEEAFNFYKSVFGGEFMDIQRFKDVPSEAALPEDEGEMIMHVALPIGDGNFLMGSDQPSSMGKVTRGDNVQISIQTDSDNETDRLFSRLAAGGQVTMALQETFWGARFGMLVDKFGIHWMVNQDISQQNKENNS